MSIEVIQAVSAGVGVEAPGSLQKTASPDFKNWLSQEMNLLNQQILTSESDLRALAAGQTDNIHQVMMSLEKAKLSFELMLQVRNKLLEGYQDVMRMQI